MENVDGQSGENAVNAESRSASLLKTQKHERSCIHNSRASGKLVVTCQRADNSSDHACCSVTDHA